MAIKKPLVYDGDGDIERLQSGDSLETGADNISRVFTATTVIGAPVYADSATSVQKAQANARATAIVVGLAAESVTAAGTGSVITDGALTATTGEWDAVTGETGGLTFNTKYYLSDAAAGAILEKGNLAGLTAGDIMVELGVGISTTEMLVRIRRGIKL